MHGTNQFLQMAGVDAAGRSKPGVMGLRNMFCMAGQPLDDANRGARNFTQMRVALNPAAPPPGSPVALHAIMPALGAAMRKLEARIERGHNELWVDFLTPGAGGPSPEFKWENPSIPSGYTYLLQFIAHDMVASAAACVAREGARAVLENMRRRPLMLDTLYGGGPDVDVSVFEFGVEHRDTKGKAPRTHLRVGPWCKPADAPITSDCPFRDLSRSKAATGEDEGLTPPFAKDWLTDAMVADRRNDTHALISQLTVLFHLLHNLVIKKLEQRPIGIPDCSVPERAYRRFLCARLAVTLIYRNIIEKDVLSLILHPDIHARYSAPGANLLDPVPGVTLEFTHGAFRFGHAMVRNEYKVNSDDPQQMERGLLLSSVRSPGFLPVTDKWLADWSRFFATGTVNPNLSRRIGPDYAPAMRSTSLFGDRETADSSALPGRDLMGANFAGLWSVPKLYEKLQQLLAGQPIASLLPPFAAWQALMSTWLSTPDPTNISAPFTTAEIAAIVADPPLPFFVMFEAAHDIKNGTPSLGGGGRTLGPFGSFITAEAMFGALRLTPVGVEDAGNALSQRISACCIELLKDAAALADIPEIASMPALLQFMGDNGVFSPPN